MEWMLTCGAPRQNLTVGGRINCGFSGHNNAIFSGQTPRGHDGIALAHPSWLASI